MTTPWERITDDTYKSWLSERQVIASEYNGASLVDRSALRQQFEQQQRQQPQFVLSEEACRNITAMARAHVEKDGSITLSSARTRSLNHVLQGLSLSIKGAIWQNKPQDLSEDDAMSPFFWRIVDEKYVDEDHPSNRKAYMDHLEKQLRLPANYVCYDAQPKRNLLDVDVKDEKSGLVTSLKGTTDVVVAKRCDVTNDAVRHNVIAQLELKRPDNTGNHEAQVCLEHLAASVLNSSVPVLTGLSNLNKMWTFYWFGDDAVPSIKKLDLEKDDPQNAAKLAKYLLEKSFLSKEESHSLPEGFTDRISWNELRKRLISSSMLHTMAEDARGGDSSDSPGQKDLSDASSRKRRNGTGPSRDNQGSSGENEPNKKQKSQQPTADDLADSLQLLCPRGDVANELSLLSVMEDEDDRIRTVREFLAIHVVPRITGVDPRTLLTDDHAQEESDAAPSLSLSAANLLQHDQSMQKNA
jgi:hypothetical protein